jgi:hypothetical protein
MCGEYGVLIAVIFGSITYSALVARQILFADGIAPFLFPRFMVSYGINADNTTSLQHAVLELSDALGINRYQILNWSISRRYSAYEV